MNLNFKFLRLIFFIVFMACGLGTSATETVNAKYSIVNENIFSNLIGNWSVLWITGQKPHRTQFVIEITNISVIFREDFQTSSLIKLAERLILFLGNSPNEEKKDFKQLNCFPTKWKPDFPISLRVQKVNESIYFMDCEEAKSLPLLEYSSEMALGNILKVPQELNFYKDKKCVLAPFRIQGYWIECLIKDEVLVILKLVNSENNCNLIFQLRRILLEETGSYSLLTTLIFLIFFALIKFFPRFYLRKGGEIINSNSFLKPKRHVLSDAKRRELVQKQIEIIRRMKKQDGID